MREERVENTCRQAGSNSKWCRTCGMQMITYMRDENEIGKITVHTHVISSYSFFLTDLVLEKKICIQICLT